MAEPNVAASHLGLFGFRLTGVPRLPVPFASIAGIQGYLQQQLGSTEFEFPANWFVFGFVLASSPVVLPLFGFLFGFLSPESGLPKEGSTGVFMSSTTQGFEQVSHNQHQGATQSRLAQVASGCDVGFAHFPRTKHQRKVSCN